MNIIFNIYAMADVAIIAYAATIKTTRRFKVNAMFSLTLLFTIIWGAAF